LGQTKNKIKFSFWEVPKNYVLRITFDGSIRFWQFRCHSKRILSEKTSRLIAGVFIFFPNQLIFLRSWNTSLLVFAIPFDGCITRNNYSRFSFLSIYIVFAFAHPPNALRPLRGLPSTVIRINTSTDNIMYVYVKMQTFTFSFRNRCMTDRNLYRVSVVFVLIADSAISYKLLKFLV